MKNKTTLYVDMSDVEDCKGFTNVYYFIHAADYLGKQCGYTKMVIKRDSRIIEHTNTIRTFLKTKLDISFDDSLDTTHMENFSSVYRVKRLRRFGLDAVFKLQFVAKFRKYGMIGFGQYPDDYIDSMTLKDNTWIRDSIKERYPLIDRTIVINIRRGDKL